MEMIITVFIQSKILSGETILSAYTNTHSRRHVYTHNLIYRQLKEITNRDLRRRKIAARSGNMADIFFGKKQCLEVGSE